MDLETWTAQTIPACFENAAVRHPDALAVVSSERTLTFHGLAAEVARLADILASHEIEEGARVILLLPDDVPLIVGWLGVLKSGAVCVPLSVHHPEERLRAVISDAEPEVVVISDAVIELVLRINVGNASIVNLDRLPASPSATAKTPALTPESPAYILYTSGTTGRPKGVIQTHRNLLKNVRAFSESMEVSAQDRFVGLTAFSMGQGVSTMFVSLLNGATLYPYNLKQAGLTSLAPWLKEQQISIYASSVSVFRQFGSLVNSDISLPHLRLIRLGTEELRIADVELFKERFPRGCVLLNCLGSTEALNYARFRIDHDTSFSGSTVPVGLPPAGSTLSVRHADGGVCQEGEIGEIVVSGSYLSPGYWRDDALTALRFFGEGEHRSYRTGDMGRRMLDGTIEFAGRVDHLVKIRGNRIELGEVEHHLAAHPAISQAAVLVRHEGNADATLVAHVATRLSAEEIRTFLKERLPEFMVPSVIVPVDSLPLAPSGKVDRDALRGESVLAGKSDTSSESRPRTGWEASIAACWSRVLEGSVAGLHDDFASLGGDSMKMLRLFVEIQSSLGIAFDARDVAKSFTVASMAEIAATRSRSPKAGISPIALEKSGGWNFVMRVRAGDEMHPIVVIPGGWGGENEILLLSGVASALQSNHAIYAVRSRAMDVEWPVAGSLREHAAAVLEELKQVITGKKWILIGECVAAAAAMEVASQAEAQGLAPEWVAMLDPFTPRRPSWMARLLGRRVEAPESAQVKSAPERIRTYYRLMKNSVPGRIASDLHVILAANAKNSDHAPEYWKRLTRGKLHLGTVSGTHESYLRSDAAETAALLNRFLFEGKNIGKRA